MKLELVFEMMGDVHERWPEKRLAADPADEHIAALSPAVFSQQLAELKSQIRGRIRACPLHYRAIAAEMTTEIARFGHAPSDNQFLSPESVRRHNHWSIESL